MLAQRIYLYDPTVANIMMQGISFLDYSRIGLPSYYAEAQIDLHLKDKQYSMFVEDFGVEEDNAFISDLETDDIERAFRAVIDAKALRDTIAVGFAPVRPLKMGDYLTTGSKYGEWVTNPL